MLFSLFKPLPLERGELTLLGAALLIVGCGQQFSATTGQAGTGGQGAASGAADSAGAAGDSTAGASNGGVSGGASGGASGASAGAAGTGGKPATTCDCAVGSYCPGGTHTCQLCSDFSALDFSAPEKLATISQSQAGNERFPRPASAGTDLFYRAGPDAKPALWYAATPVSGVGKPLLAATGIDSGPLFAPGFSPPQNFFFDRATVATGVRQIMVGTWANGALTQVFAAPAPLNGMNGDFSVAIAANVRRAYWMSSRNNKGAPELLWAAFGLSATTPQVLSLEVQAGAGKCPRLGDDATPWVNAAGTLLLFRSESQDNNCQPNDSGAYDLFAAALGKDGLPVAPGVPLSALNNTGGMSTETDPSLSQDSCTIYFSSNNDQGNYYLYRAARN